LSCAACTCTAAPFVKTSGNDRQIHNKYDVITRSSRICVVIGRNTLIQSPKDWQISTVSVCSSSLFMVREWGISTPPRGIHRTRRIGAQDRDISIHHEIFVDQSANTRLSAPDLNRVRNGADHIEHHSDALYRDDTQC